MKIKWVKIMDDGGGSGLRLARRLVELQIMPVVRLYPGTGQNPGTIGSRGGDTVRKYLEAGVCYFETNNEPDLALEWKGGVRPDNWLDVVVDTFIADADVILSLGGYPAVPAFGVGTQRDPFAKIIDRGRMDILDGGAWAALHNYCLGRPLEYPNDGVNLYGTPLTQEEWDAAGGLWAWEMGVNDVNEERVKHSNPVASILTDSTCFRAFEQLDALVVQACGHSIPIMTTEGGYNVGQRAGTTYGDDARYPKPTPQRASELNRDMFAFMQGDKTILGQSVPEYYFACMPWIVAAYEIGVFAAPTEGQGPWFTHWQDTQFGLTGELPIVQMLKELPTCVRQDGPVPAEWNRLDYEHEPQWDHRFRYMGVQLERIGFPDDDYWQLVEARWLDEDEAGPQAGYIWVRVLDANSDPIEGATVAVARAGAVDVVATKGPPDNFLANYVLNGQLGTYDVSVQHSGLASERIIGLGLGTEDNRGAWTKTAFILTFQLVVDGNPEFQPPRDRRDPYWRGR